jgi:hypothetical protein
MIAGQCYPDPNDCGCGGCPPNQACLRTTLAGFENYSYECVPANSTEGVATLYGCVDGCCCDCIETNDCGSYIKQTRGPTGQEYDAARSQCEQSNSATYHQHFVPSSMTSPQSGSVITRNCNLVCGLCQNCNRIATQPNGLSCYAQRGALAIPVQGKTLYFETQPCANQGQCYEDCIPFAVCNTDPAFEDDNCTNYVTAYYCTPPDTGPSDPTPCGPIINGECVYDPPSQGQAPQCYCDQYSNPRYTIYGMTDCLGEQHTWCEFNCIGTLCVPACEQGFTCINGVCVPD